MMLSRASCIHCRSVVPVVGEGRLRAHCIVRGGYDCDYVRLHLPRTVNPSQIRASILDLPLGRHIDLGVKFIVTVAEEGD